MQESRYNQSLDILKAGASESKGEECRLGNFMGAIALSDLVKTTLGPHGMDKILVGGGHRPDRSSCAVTNDGATILKSIHVDNPAAKILIDISKTQDEEVGDGTTSVCVLAGELLRKAEHLIMVKQIHPQVIVDGWRQAVKVARSALEDSATNNSGDKDLFRRDLLNVARTTLSSKVLNCLKEHFSVLAVDAVMRIGEADSAHESNFKGRAARNLELISIMKKLGGTLEESTLQPGFLLDKKIGTGQPKVMKNCKVLVANTPMDTDKIKIFGARVKVDSVDAVADIERAEKEKMRSKCERIMAFGCNVFINRQLIYNYPEEIFADNGVMAIEHADFDGVERLAFALGGEVVSQFETPDESRLGGCDMIDEIMIGEDNVIRFSGLKGGQACTIVLRGSSQQVLDEADRSLRDALCIVQSTTRDPRVVYGAGCSEALMAAAIHRELNKVSDGESDSPRAGRAGKKLAMEAFRDALMQIPLILAENGGIQSDVVDELEQVHRRALGSRIGIDVHTGELLDAEAEGITESFHSKSSSLEYAAEAAEMILRVDNVIRCAPRQRTR